jgi:phosphoglycerate dehydrogenase-like enzyme
VAFPNPHVAGRSDRIGEQQRELVRDNIARFVGGQSLRNIVDKKRGY